MSEAETATVARATELRLAGRWQEATTELDGLATPDALMARLQVLSDEHLFARDRGLELRDGLDQLAELAAVTSDAMLEAFVLSRRGLALHVEYLSDPEAGEPPEEMSLFESALEIRKRIGDQRGQAESLFHIGLVHQIVRHDADAALGLFRTSYDVAREVGDIVMMSYAIRHVGYIEQAGGNIPAAEAAFAESLHLRREAGWKPGVAAAELALASVLAEQGRSDEARNLARSAAHILTELDCDRFQRLVADDLSRLLEPSNRLTTDHGDR
jgi:tetratricopeptide (TPR) repeat protein